MVDKTPEPGSNEWWDDLTRKIRDIRVRINQLTKNVEESTKNLRQALARLQLSKIKRHPELRKEYVNKLYNPFYEPTPVEEIVIRTLLGEEQDGKDS